MSKYIIGRLHVVVIIACAAFFAEHAGWLHGFDTAARDTLTLFPAFIGNRKPTGDIKIVGILEDDFARYGSRHPIDPKPILRLLQEIAAGRPKIIGVDLDTSGWTADDYSEAPTSIKIIWARDSRAQNGAIIPLDTVLGGAKGGSAWDTGIAALPRDSDGISRRYRRVFQTSEGKMQSFPWAIASSLRGVQPAHALDMQDDVMLNFMGDSYDLEPLPAWVVEKASSGSGWATSGPLTDRVVLVGGFYHAARDEHAVSTGTLQGVQVMAQCVGTELDSKGIRLANEFIMFLLDIAVGIVLTIVIYSWPIKSSMVYSTLAFIVMAPLCSYAAFSSFALWANFIPVLVGVVVHDLWDQANHNSRLRGEAHFANK